MKNPEKIEIECLKTIHKLCKFGADHNMEGCTFTEIVERMFSKIEQMKTQVNTLDEMLLNQGEALAQAKAQAVPEWISVNNRLPECMHECTASGLEISDTVLVSNSKDNPSIGFGHLREDGNWVVYEGEHDFMNPQKVTHWMLMLKGASQ